MLRVISRPRPPCYLVLSSRPRPFWAALSVNQGEGETIGRKGSTVSQRIGPIVPPLRDFWYDWGMSPQFDPHKHHRRSIRWKGWDYGASAYYFITICTHQRTHLFENEQFREIALFAWQQLPGFPKSQHIGLDEFVIMPNHLHGIVGIYEQRNQSHHNELDSTFRNVESGKLGRVIGTYKALITRRINKIRGSVSGKVWQKGYWDRVIRNESEFYAIKQYIRNNPRRWAEDRENLDGLTNEMNFHP